MRPVLACSLLLPLALPLLACGDKADADSGASDGDGGDDGGDDGDSGTTGTGDCVPTADGVLPDGADTLAWDDDSPVASIIGQGFAVGDYALEDNPLHEWVRFESTSSMEIVGISVAFDGLPDDPETPVEVRLFDDFGYNGFDAWHPEPLWTGTRCAGDLAEGEWTTFVLDEPISFDRGDLVYAGHLRQAGGPAILFDGGTDGDGTCATFDECHSAMNTPELTSFVSGGYSYSFWKGYSFSFQYDYLVRLHVVVRDEARPEPMFEATGDVPTGSRQAWGDVDNDGDDDLYVPGALYINEGAGTFVDYTDTSGIAAMGISSSGGVFGDYDNDGCLDLFVFAESYTASDSLLQGDCDGGFTDVTAAAGITDVQDYNLCNGDDSRDRTPSAGAAWADLDNDGFLDLYVADFICWDDYSYYRDQVWHNEGDGTFTEWTGEQGFSSSRTASRGANPIDHDQDGDIDILVNNYVLQQNLFFDNQTMDGEAPGTVAETAAAVGLGGTRSFTSGGSYYGHTIGTAWGDLDNDGDWDVIQANLAHPRFFDFSDKTQVLLNDGTGVFEDNAGDWEGPYSDNGLRYQETHSIPTLGDFDSDGILDLAITAVYDGRPTDFYWGNGDGTFRPAWAHSGIDAENGWGMSAADWDNDGDLDLLTSQGAYENVRDQGSWLQVRARCASTCNAAAIGATVVVETGDGDRVMRHVQGGTGQGEQDSQTLHFGLGGADSVAGITIAFPGADTITVEGPFDVNQRLWIWEDGSVYSGWAPPTAR